MLVNLDQPSAANARAVAICGSQLALFRQDGTGRRGGNSPDRETNWKPGLKKGFPWSNLLCCLLLFFSSSFIFVCFVELREIFERAIAKYARFARWTSPKPAKEQDISLGQTLS